MQEQLLNFFKEYPQLAIFISLIVSVIIAVIGIVPSVFITGANIIFFGFWQGALLSFLGEAIGAAVALWLYRKGFKKGASKSLERFPKARRLIQAEGKEAFILILSMRLLPFVPSGLVTFAAAIGKVSFLLFLMASSIGKIPALLIEAYAVYQVTQTGWQSKIILVAVAAVLVYFIIRKINEKDKKKD